MTPLAKVLITLVLVGGIGMVIYRNQDQIRGLRKGTSQPGTGGPATAGTKEGARRRIVVGVNDFGGAYPALVANDGATPGPGSLFAKQGLDVEIKLVRGSKERLEQFDAGQIDIMLLTLDYVANLAAVKTGVLGPVGGGAG